MKINKRMQIFELRTQYNIYLMTLAVQEKGKRLTNEDIYHCIIKKENSVNPFLTVMNFKISFKTWIKFARKKVKEQHRLEHKLRGGQDDYYDQYASTLHEDEVRKPYSVEIEVDTYFSVTSEEDSGMEIISEYKKPKGVKSQSGSQMGSQYNVSGSVKNDAQNMKKKQKDHLKLFEKKMT